MDDPTAATSHDTSRPAATNTDNDYNLSLEQVSEFYAKAGHPRTLRSLQRYCVNGHLDAQKIATTLGDKYLVTPQSVARHIAQIEELNALDTVATSRAFSRPVATAPEDVVPPVAAQESPKEPVPPPPTGDDNPRQETTGKRDTSRYVERLEREVEQAKDERDFLREQIDRKDKTIDSLLERDRETNFLIRGLQDLIPRLGMAHREPPPTPPAAQ
jgi:hypothetical protein